MLVVLCFVRLFQEGDLYFANVFFYFFYRGPKEISWQNKMDGLVPCGYEESLTWSRVSAFHLARSWWQTGAVDILGSLSSCQPCPVLPELLCPIHKPSPCYPSSYLCGHRDMMSYGMGPHYFVTNSPSSPTHVSSQQMIYHRCIPGGMLGNQGAC